MMTSPHRSLGMFLTLLATVVLAGCSGASRFDVGIKGPVLGADSRPAVDVHNWNGSVRVIVEPGRKQASVWAKVRPVGKDSPTGSDLADACLIAAESVQQEGHMILRVVSESKLADPDQSAADLVIRLPSCGGVYLRNAGGPVVLRGVGGAVSVENGTGNRPGGRIELRTNVAITDPVTLMTTDGNVHFQAPPNSTGRFDLTTDNGRAALFAHAGVIKTETVTPSRFVGTLNGGGNLIQLRSGRGRVEAYILDDAGFYRPAHR
jgi:hypothetical protein